MRLKDYSERTIKDYGNQLSFFLRYLKTIEINQINHISKETISNYQMSLLTQEKQISLETQYSRIVALKSFFKYLSKTNQVLYDPTTDVELPRRKKNIPKDIMNRKEITKILNQPNPDTAIGLRDKAILEMLYSTAIRNQEIRNLTIYDVDTTNNYVRINQGKGKKDRVVPLGEIASNYIEEYINHSRPKLLNPVRRKSQKESVPPMKGASNGVNNKQINILFITLNAKAINHTNLIWMIKKYAKKAKIEKHITPHSFRHTCATHLLKNNASLRHIQELLGHSSIETTQIYTKIDITDLKQAHKKYHPRERGD